MYDDPKPPDADDHPTPHARAEAIARGASAATMITTIEEMRAELGDLGTSAKEFLSMLPGGPYPLEFLRSSWEEDVSLLARGAHCCVLYQADAVRCAEVLRYLSQLTEQGAKIKVATRVPYRMVIIDRSHTFIGVEEDQLGLPYLAVRENALVRTLYERFALQWKNAHSIGFGAEDSLANDIVIEVVEALMTGVTDEVAARRLNVSVRTMRRRVAAVMDLLGASSRFEAGIKAAKYGWV